MSLRPAIIYSTDEVYVEFTPEKFIKLLKHYIDQHGSVDKAVDNIIFDLKKKTLYK